MPERGERRLHNWLQQPIQSAWTVDLDFMSRASVAQGCGTKTTSPFLHHYGACPVFPEQLHNIMQRSYLPERAFPPHESDPPTLYRPRPPPAPLPAGHTVPVAEDDKGKFGKLPPQPLQISVLATPRILKKVGATMIIAGRHSHTHNCILSATLFLKLTPAPPPSHPRALSPAAVYHVLVSRAVAVPLTHDSATLTTSSMCLATNQLPLSRIQL